MELTLDTNNILFVSDLHFNHRKLCTGYVEHFDRTRKYVTIEEMNNDIVEQWNNVANDDSIVFFLGDFTLGTPASKLVELFSEYYPKLKFKHMYWIMGNHDHEIFKRLTREFNGNKPIDNFPKVTLIRDHVLLNHNGINYLLQHYTFNDQDDKGYKDSDSSALNHYEKEGKFISYLVHGHTHEFDKTTKCIHKGIEMVQNNVNWESYYRPVRITELCPKDDGKTLIIVRGLPGSGKSTYAKKLYNNLTAQGHVVKHFESDSFWMNAYGEYSFNPMLLETAHRTCFLNTFFALKDKVSFVIVSNTFVKENDILEYTNEAKKYGAHVIVYRMENNFGSIHGVPEETMDKMRRGFVNYPGEVIIRVDKK